MSEKPKPEVIQVVQEILKGSKHHRSIFRESEILALETDISTTRKKDNKDTDDTPEIQVKEKLSVQKGNGKIKFYILCPIRGRKILLKPEEVVRQLYLRRLINDYGYDREHIRVEYPIDFGLARQKRADIVVLNKDDLDAVYIIVEVKRPKLKDGKNQLKSYCHATGTSMAVWTNGQQISYYNRKDPNHFEDITEIPDVDQTLKDILEGKFTIKDLILRDKLATERKTLKDVILELENEVLSNSGKDVFEEVFKLIFTKLYDEFQRRDQKTKIEGYLEQHLGEASTRNFEQEKECLNRFDDSGFKSLEFRNIEENDTDLKDNIQVLFEKAKVKWPDVFSEDSKFELDASHLAICVSSLQYVKLFNSNLTVLDEAFEYLINKTSKGEKGQYFTPRHVIDMCVQMLNPKKGETMIDPASGSCGFPVHTIFKLTGNLFKNKEISDEDKEHALKVFGIDFDEKTVRVARTLNLIAGDGETNVLELDTLDYTRWSASTNNSSWSHTYGRGFRRLEKLRANKNDNKKFNFDILMANPPFAGDIKIDSILSQYCLSYKDNSNRKAYAQVRREILFIERSLNFLKPGGRMAIVLPLGKFSAPKYQYIRDFITKQARILAVVSLHENTFRPHTDTKTSVLFVQKWNGNESIGDLCPKPEGLDYNIFFAVSQKKSKNNSGDYIYVKDNDINIWDKNGHVIVDHDLHNHDGYLEKGIAESFIEWAKKESLSFADLNVNVQDWNPIPNLTFEKTYENIQSEERMDAVYFHPKYEEIEELIKSYPNGHTYVRKEFNQSTNSFRKDLEKWYHYVEIGDIDIYTGNITPERMLGSELPKNAKYVLKKGDILVSTVRTYRGAVSIVQEDGLIGSGAFCILRENGRINKETLYCLLRSERFLEWSRKGEIWTSYPKLHDRYILDYPIPLLPKEVQAKIRGSVTEHFKQLEESKALLRHSLESVEKAFKLEDN